MIPWFQERSTPPQIHIDICLSASETVIMHQMVFSGHFSSQFILSPKFSTLRSVPHLGNLQTFRVVNIQLMIVCLVNNSNDIAFHITHQKSCVCFLGCQFYTDQIMIEKGDEHMRPLHTCERGCSLPWYLPVLSWCQCCVHFQIRLSKRDV